VEVTPRPFLWSRCQLRKLTRAQIQSGLRFAYTPTIQGKSMTHTGTSVKKAIGGLAAAALASAAFVTSAVGSAPPAHATCASFFGLGNGNGCKSTFGGVAIAIGTGATAVATGFLSTAVAIGTGTAAEGLSNLGLAVALGNGGGAEAGTSVFSNLADVAIDLGNHSEAIAYAPMANGFGNMVFNAGDGNTTYAVGALDSSVNLGNGNEVVAEGVATNAMNVGGTHNFLEARGGTGLTSPGLNTVFALLSNDTNVTAEGGPLAIAGSIGQTSQDINKQTAGFNINGIKVGGAAAPAQATKAATTVKAAGLGGSKKRTTGSAAPAKHTSTK
jgi:hypothetical protein